MPPHERLALQSGVVMRLGLALLGSGAGAFRVKDSMSRLAHAVGIESHRGQVTFTEITTTSFANGTFRTEIGETRRAGVDADKIDRLREFVRGLRPGMSVEDAHAALDEIESARPLYGAVANMLAAAFACAGFAFLNKGGLVECLVVFFAALVGQATRRQMMHRHMNHFGVWMLCGALGTLIYTSFVTALNWFGWVDHNHQAGVISAILFLVPGFPLVTGILDLVRMDLLAGITRLSYVTVLLASTGIAVWAVSASLHWDVNPSVGPELSPVVLNLLRILASFIASFGFAMLFNSPLKVASAAAGIAAVTNTGRLLLVDHTAIVSQAAVGLAALFIGLLASLLSILWRYSRVTLSVPAVVIMIPGVPLYRALTAMSNGEVTSALAQVVQVVFVVCAIGVGLAVSRMITDRGWAFDQDTTRTRRIFTDVAAR
nr:threonine/serine exporter family protein [Bowdeniella nasicola]